MMRVLLVLLLVVTAAFGQTGKASLKGQVSDEFGGVIIGATVVATDAKLALVGLTQGGRQIHHQC